MAAKKRKKRAPQLWAARDMGSDDIYTFNGKPRIDEEMCDSCGGTRKLFQGNVLGEPICADGFAKATSITVNMGEVIQLKVTRVEEASK